MNARAFDHPPLRPRRLGLTLLEVVLALATLMIAASALLGGVSFASMLAQRDERTLEATEVAHRLILQHMEDPNFFVGQPKRTEINGRYYAFTLAEEVVTADDRAATAGNGPLKYKAGALADAVGDDRLKGANRLVVRVFPDDDNTGPARKVALAELSRYYIWTTGGIDEDDMLNEVKRRFGATLDQSGLGTTINPK